MMPLLFALALLAAPAPEQPTTAGQLYNGCVRYVSRKPSSPMSQLALAEKWPCPR